MVALPEAGSGVRYRVARYVDVYVGEAENPIQAAREALANMDNATIEGDRPILEVTDLETGEVTDVDFEQISVRMRMTRLQIEDAVVGMIVEDLPCEDHAEIGCEEIEKEVTTCMDDGKLEFICVRCITRSQIEGTDHDI